MAKQDFIPTRDSDFVDYHDNFKTVAAADGVTVGLTAADLTAITGDNGTVHTVKNASDSAYVVSQQTTKTLRSTFSTVKQNVRTLARRIKIHPAYTEALGKKFGIEGAEDTTDMTTAKPTLKGKALLQGHAQVGFDKQKSDGVNVYSKRDGDTDWVKLAFDTYSPYLDNRPLLVAGKPEQRRYRACYVVADEEVGQYSDEIVVTVQP